MTKIQFASGITVIIEDGLVNSPTMELTALLDALGLPRFPVTALRRLNWTRTSTLPRHHREIGAGKIVAQTRLAH